MRTVGLVALVLSGSLALAACSGATDAAPVQSAAVPTASAMSTTSPTSTTCTVPEDLLDQDVERLPIKKKKVALTFDGGSGAEAAESILDTLEGRHVPGTFFLTGDFVRSFPETAKRIADEHLVGNHTNTHPDLTTLTDDEIRSEVRRAQRVILRKTGEDPRRFFRFPFGARNAHTIDVVNGLCYVPFRWTVDTLGWKGTTGGQTVKTVVKRVLDGAEPGEVVLMHLGAHPKDKSTLDADALPRIIKRLRALDYSFVRLSRILSPEP
jgi:peptidoglycan/xylan/chitin deacetylase (PgdA/CDA1 family)